MVPPVERRDELPPHMVSGVAEMRMDGSMEGFQLVRVVHAQQPSVNTTGSATRTSCVSPSLLSAAARRACLLKKTDLQLPLARSYNGVSDCEVRRTAHVVVSRNGSPARE